MFATLAGGYPRPDLPIDAPIDDVIRAVIAAQQDAGLEILSDAGLRRPDPITAITSRLQGFEIGEATPQPGGGTSRRSRALHEPRWDGPIFVRDWEAAAAASELPVKQILTGPYTIGRLTDPGPLTRERLTMALADALAHEIRALIAAGVPMIQVQEDGATSIGESPAEQQLFKAAHRRLTNGIGEAHLTLAVVGGSIAALPTRTVFDAPYRSYLIDIVTAPENWRLIATAPAERGIILGAADVRTDAPDDPIFLTWAATNAAAMGARGPERVGLAPSGSLADRDPAAARAKISALAAVAAETHARIGADAGLLDLEGLARDGLEHGWFGTVDAPAAVDAVRRASGGAGVGA